MPDWAPIIGQVVIFLTTVSGFLYTLYREKTAREVEERNRAWDLEDRIAAREALEVKVKEVAATAIVANQEIRDKIDENTLISQRAFDEANHSNRKIIALSEAFDSIYERRASHHRRRADDDPLQAIVESTQKTVEATHKTVESIDEKIDDKIP